MATLRSAILASCAAAAAAHVTFKLPATAGATPVALYPNTAPSGGYGAPKKRGEHLQDVMGLELQPPPHRQSAAARTRALLCE